MSKVITTIADQLSAGAKNQLTLLCLKDKMEEMEDPRMHQQLQQNRINFNKTGRTDGKKK